MCGLVGVAGDIAAVDKKVFKDLLHLDIIRGPHSTGVASVSGQGTWSVAKKKGTAWDLFDSKSYDDVMRPLSYALIGHNRYATKGAVNNANAHPFEFRNVVGAHNGTIKGQWRLPDHTDFEVDSENIFYSIQTQGLEETLKILDGAYALSYWDNRSNELVLLRNSQRELKYCYSLDGSTVYWASEAWMLHIALSRNGVKFTEPRDVEEGQIHRFTFPMRYMKDSQVSLETEPFEEFVAPVSRFPATTTTATGTGYQSKKLEDKTGSGKSKVTGLLGSKIQFVIDGAVNRGAGMPYLSGTAIDHEGVEVKLYPTQNSQEWNDFLAMSSDTIFEGDVATELHYANQVVVSWKSVVELEEDEDDLILGFENRRLTEQQFLIKTEKGCAWCASPGALSKASTYHWVADSEFICEDCQNTDEVKEHLMG